MRLISFALTTPQVRARTKTVTRRTGWRTLQPGTLLQPVVKGQGIPKGGHVETIGGPIRVVSVRRERLDDMQADDLAREGFAETTLDQFICVFCRSHRCSAEDVVTRIEFEYVD